MFDRNPMPVKIKVEPDPARAKPAPPAGSIAMLSPTAAWRSLCARTGGVITLVTFYRWLRNGKVYSIRLGQRVFIPQDALDDLIRKCLEGEKV